MNNMGQRGTGCTRLQDLARLGPVSQLAQTGHEAPWGGTGALAELLGTPCLPNVCLVLCHLMEVIHWSEVRTWGWQENKSTYCKICVN